MVQMNNLTSHSGSSWQIRFFLQPQEQYMNTITRAQITPGISVKIVLKQDQRSGKLTEGIVQDILTNSPTHPHGIKVRLTSGEVGRVQEICR